MEHVYLDHAATTPMHENVRDRMYAYAGDSVGNPSSIHGYGRKGRKYLDDAREMIARSIHADTKEIIFTSGGTESNNLALTGAARANKDKGRHIIMTNAEHHAILHTAEALEEEGFHVTYIPVDENGLISAMDVKQALTDETIVVSVMYVNNETGAVQPIREVGDILRDHQAVFHTDAVQAYGFIAMDVDELGVDLLSVSAHKIYGPEGFGFLFMRSGVPVSSLLHGGEQERKMRAGTENAMGAVGMQAAVELTMDEREQRYRDCERFKNIFLETLDAKGVVYDVNGTLDGDLPSIVNISFPGAQVEPLLMNADISGIAASSGSACTAGSVEPSHVLSAMYGEDDDRVMNSIRFSFGKMNTDENVRYAAEKIASIVERIKQ